MQRNLQSCGAGDWAAFHDGYTVPDRCAEGADIGRTEKGSSDLKYHVIALAIIATAFSPRQSCSFSSSCTISGSAAAKPSFL